MYFEVFVFGMVFFAQGYNIRISHLPMPSLTMLFLPAASECAQ